MTKCGTLLVGSLAVNQAGDIQQHSLPKDEVLPSTSSATRSARTSQQSSLETEENPAGTNDGSFTFINPAPDGGLQAWCQVLMGHLMNFNTWGYINSFGLFEAYYISHLNLSASAVSWIGSIQIFLLCFVGAFSGRALDAGYYRHVMIAGCFLQVFGIFMTSLATGYWQLFLAQGICQGLGNGLVFSPTIALVSTYFVKKRSLAVAIVAGGSGTGGIIFVVLAQHLLPSLGFPWALRIMGFVSLLNAIIIVLLAKPRLPPRKSGPLFEFSAFNEVPFLLFVIGMFLTLWPVYFDFDYINVYARNILDISSTESLTFLLIINSVGLPGRVIPALLADFAIGPLNTLILLVIICAIFNYIWIGVQTYNGLIAFVVFFGLVNGGVQGIFLSALSSLTTDFTKMGTRTGMVLTVIAFSTLTGAPIAGALIEKDGGDFLGVQIFGGTVMLVGCGITVAARAAKTGWILRKRM